jgi:hypothetical protein
MTHDRIVVQLPKMPLVLATPNFEYVVWLVSRSDKQETRQSLQIDGFGEDP